MKGGFGVCGLTAGSLNMYQFKNWFCFLKFAALNCSCRMCFRYSFMFMFPLPVPFRRRMWTSWPSSHGWWTAWVRVWCWAGPSWRKPATWRTQRRRCRPWRPKCLCWCSCWCTRMTTSRQTSWASATSTCTSSNRWGFWGPGSFSNF